MNIDFEEWKKDHRPLLGLVLTKTDVSRTRYHDSVQYAKSVDMLRTNN